MLWKKESHAPNALYTDILALCTVNLETELHKFIAAQTDIKPIPRKNDAIALQNRNKGNTYFRANKLDMAMEWYNDSLRFAEPGSEQISLAYANRSACFLKLNMYEKCLEDIKLAKAAGYPEHLMSKLDQRKVECLKRLEAGTESCTIGAKLSFQPDKNFPSMANVLKVQTDQHGDYMIVAKQDIDVDRTIVVEDAMFPYLLKRYGLKCNICLKGNENLVPCKTCAIAMFCSNCHGHFLHEYECGLKMCGDCSVNSDYMSVIRVILLTIKMFPTIDELMAFVEQILIEPKRQPMNLKNPQSKYRAFFNRPLDSGKIGNSIEKLALSVYPTYQNILQIPQINAMFQSQKHMRFLMHLIGHYSLISFNMVRFGHATAPEVYPLLPDENDPLFFAMEIDLMDQYFQHSCFPNALNVMSDGKSIMVTARPIKNGEQLYFSHDPIGISRKTLGVKCVCKRCTGAVANSAQRKQLSAEPAYCNLLADRTWISGASDKVESAIGNCVMLLKKYSSINWCPEIKNILHMYQVLLCIRTAGSSSYTIKYKSG